MGTSFPAAIAGDSRETQADVGTPELSACGPLGSSWAGDLVPACSLGRFGRRVSADGVLPGERQSPKVFLFEVIVTSPQGSDLSWSWVGH